MEAAGARCTRRRTRPRRAWPSAGRGSRRLAGGGGAQPDTQTKKGETGGAPALPMIERLGGVVGTDASGVARGSGPRRAAIRSAAAATVIARPAETKRKRRHGGPDQPTGGGTLQLDHPSIRSGQLCESATVLETATTRSRWGAPAEGPWRRRVLVAGCAAEGSCAGGGPGKGVGGGGGGWAACSRSRWVEQ